MARMASAEHPQATVQAKNLHGECEACDGNSWAVTDDTYILSAVDEHSRLTMQGMPVHVMVCEECGFVRLFARTIV
jgi:hypothetical protein